MTVKRTVIGSKVKAALSAKEILITWLNRWIVIGLDFDLSRCVKKLLRPFLFVSGEETSKSKSTKKKLEISLAAANHCVFSISRKGKRRLFITSGKQVADVIIFVRHLCQKSSIE